MLDQLPFKLYKRTLKSGKKVYYVRFLLPDGKYTDGRSTGELSKRKAEIKAWNYIKKGNPTSLQNLKIKEYSKNFFNWDGEWALSKRSAGRKLSKEQCNKNNGIVKLHINRLIQKISNLHFSKPTLYYSGHSNIPEFGKRHLNYNYRILEPNLG